MSKQLFSNKDWGVFIGAFNENKMHQHYAIQLSIGLEYGLVLKDLEANKKEGNSFLIKSNVPHQLYCKGNQLLMLINPLSALGHFFLNYIQEDFQPFQHGLVTELENIASKLLQEDISYSFFVEQIQALLTQFVCECENHANTIDERIVIALEYLDKNDDRVILVNELATIVNLSESRFLHLFRNEVGITFRRAQLWKRVAKSIPELKSKSVTAVAYEYGFSDSAHYNKIVNQTFGFSPKEFLKYS